MNRLYADTQARYVEHHGYIVDPWLEPDDQAIPVASLATYRTLWQHEDEAPREVAPVVEPRYGAVQAAVLAYLREHGEAQATDIARAIRIGNLTAIRSRLCAMEREGKVRRVVGYRGRYVLA